MGALISVKHVLYRLGLFSLAGQIRNNTWRYLRGGYSPRRFWEGWGDVFPDLKFQKEIHAGQRWLVDKIQSLPGTRVLEVGCGFGRNLGFLNQELTGPRTFWGIDISSKMASRGRRSLSSQCHLACGDILNLPFRAGSFELVFTHGVLMHVQPPNLTKALAEISRLATGYVLFVEEAYWKGLPKSGSTQVNPYTYLHDYSQALPEAGFKIIEAGETGGPVNMLVFLCRPLHSLSATSLAEIP